MSRWLPRPLVLLFTACTAFVGGVAYEHLGHDAQAQAAGVTTLYVPQGGLVFRSVDGAPLARISKDARGGVVEVYDERHEVATRLSAPHGSRPRLVDDNPYASNDEDLDPFLPKPSR
ncbi:MAG TPA: hypothetical protein VIF09_12675 [Polyangiaceae bacterium]|jgi:hypothetical protein